MNGFLGIDTSCYTTSVAAVAMDGSVLASNRLLLPVDQGQRGLRQSEAVFVHVRQIPILMEEMMAKLSELDFHPLAVTASCTPTAAKDSYMPVFKAGEAVGRSLAAVLNVPFYEGNHQLGHIFAAKVESGLEQDTFLALHLSGGTTDLLVVQDEEIRQLGGSLDLHAGQLVDRCGVAMGLPFPAGPSLEKLAIHGKSRSLLPVSMERGGLSCHLSGVETKAQSMIASGRDSMEDIAAEIYDLLSRCVMRMLLAGEKETGLHHALIAGGVASSSLFRTLLTARMAKQHYAPAVYFGHSEYSGDNAVGAALIGRKRYLSAQ